MTLVETVLAMATFGAASAVHCAGMCGPLALRGCSRACSVSPRLTLQYVSGRATAYVFLGVVAGTVGSHALARVGSVPRTWVAELVALVLIVDGIRLLRAKRVWAPPRVAATEPSRELRSRFPGGPRSVRRALRETVPSPLRDALRWLQAVAPRQGLGLGLVTGFLPCGALLSALLLASSSGNAVAAALGMLVFSVASLPGVLAPLLLARPLRSVVSPLRVPRLATAAGGTVLVLLGLWVAVRPLRVGRTGACHEGVAASGGAAAVVPAPLRVHGG